MCPPTSYPLNEKLLRAIQLLFDDPAEGLGFLGLQKRVLPSSWFRNPLDTSENPIQRAQKLRSQVEGFLELMGREVDELGEEDRARLKNEARGLLLALREIWLHFPEVSEVP